MTGNDDEKQESTVAYKNNHCSVTICKVCFSQVTVRVAASFTLFLSPNGSSMSVDFTDCSELTLEPHGEFGPWYAADCSGMSSVSETATIEEWRGLELELECGDLTWTIPSSLVGVPGKGIEPSSISYTLPRSVEGFFVEGCRFGGGGGRRLISLSSSSSIGMTTQNSVVWGL